MNGSALISCEELRQNPHSDKQVILDATFFLPRQQRNAKEEYRQSHIPDALFFDIDEIADPNAPLPHTLPNAERFAEAAGKMGIADDTPVIVYDNNHFFAAARAWWMFRVFGHDHVKVLDGGLARWGQLAYSEESMLPSPRPQRCFGARYRSELVCDISTMKQIQQDSGRQIIDARSPESFQGRRSLSEPGLQPGHIPGSINIPYSGLTDSEQRLLPPADLRELFSAAGADLTEPIVTTCGSGVSACVLALALYRLGIEIVPVYDGSWAEWGRHPDTPKQTL
ncbi:sulfurtransferase [Methylomarinum vadi]|uniref:sulfurtransferase n=1 Tax=Methylomarinum vadi TaxID=438855 RepID=UPI0004DF3EEA|nr:sulfurtransferase [Methylomarinum vadi]